MKTATLSTIENDGSVSDDPCQACEGRLVLRRSPTGGWFLGCSNFPKGCTFKMAPNTEQMEELERQREERRKIRAEKRRKREEEEARKAEEKRLRTPPPPKFCEECFSRLSNVDVQSGRDKHVNC